MSSPDPFSGPALLFAFFLAYAWLVSSESSLRALGINRLQREEMADQRHEKTLNQLYGAHENHLTALQIAKTMIVLLIGVVTAVSPARRLASYISHQISGSTAFICIIAAVICWLFMLLLLTVCTVIPERSAEKRFETVLVRRAGVIRALTILLMPSIWLYRAISSGLLHLFGFQSENAQDEVTEEDIRLMVDMGSESGALEENEKEMIENIFKFNDRTAEDVMTHRTNVTALWVGDDHDTVVRTILDTGYSRFPVYNEDMDDIIGILNTRDYLLDSHRDKPKPIRELLREAYFVPETVQADALFRDMQKRKVQMAIVVDEYGGMSGIITMEDLLEEIVGNIYDEFDDPIENDIVPIGDNLWRISGAATLEDVSEALDVDLPTEEDYDTLGGFVFSQLTTIPEDGSHPEMDVNGLHIRVEKLVDHRVETALVSILKETTDSQSSNENNQASNQNEKS